MAVIGKHAFVALTFLIGAVAPLCAGVSLSIPDVSAFIGLWPQPQSQVLNGNLLPLDLAGLRVFCSPDPCGEVLKQATVRFEENARHSNYRRANYLHHLADGAALVAAKGPPVSRIELQVDNQAEEMGLSMDESYDIQMSYPGREVRVRAANQVGALHALETLAQLLVAGAPPRVVAADTDTRQGGQQQGQQLRPQAGDQAGAAGAADGSGASTLPGWASGRVWLVAANISDRPRFPLRGLRLDTRRPPARPPLPALHAALDTMAASKLNVLLWRVGAVDLPAGPQGSGEQEQQPGFDAREYVQGLAAYAALRGIRLLLEPDVSASGAGVAGGHTGGRASSDQATPVRVGSAEGGVRVRGGAAAAAADDDADLYGLNELDPEEQEQALELLEAEQVARVRPRERRA